MDFHRIILVPSREPFPDEPDDGSGKGEAAESSRGPAGDVVVKRMVDPMPLGTKFIRDEMDVPRHSAKTIVRDVGDAQKNS